MSASQTQAIVSGLRKLRRPGRSCSQGAANLRTAVLHVIREGSKKQPGSTKEVRFWLRRIVDQVAGANKASFSNLDEALFASSVALVIGKAVAK